MTLNVPGADQLPVVRCLTFNHNGQLLATGDAKGVVRILGGRTEANGRATPGVANIATRLVCARPPTPTPPHHPQTCARCPWCCRGRATTLVCWARGSHSMRPNCAASASTDGYGAVRRPCARGPPANTDGWAD